MRIYSWNMLYRNRELDRALEFIAQSNFDIFCLQEVPEHFLEQLKTLPYSMAYELDVERIFKKHTERIYVVILSRYAISTRAAIPLPEYWNLLPRHTRLFVEYMPDQFFSKIRNRNSMYADVVTPQGIVRVFNLHLILAHPAWRQKEFEKAMEHYNSAVPTIVCGDFNTLQKLHITPLNWLLGGKMSDVFFYGRERKEMEKMFVKIGLQNAFRNKTTHPLSRSQLDHILLSKSFSLQSAAVLPDRVGSDHNPITASIEI